MITAEQIPDEVVKAAARQICGYERDQDMDWREYIGHARAAIAAALNAWSDKASLFLPNSPGSSSGELIIYLPVKARDGNYDYVVDL